MTADERIALIRVKIERAKKHIRDLEMEINSFFSSEPYALAKHDPQTRELIYYLTRAREVPPEIPAIIGDALQNLRTALDHLAHQLVLVGSPGTIPDENVGFPIFKDAAIYESSRAGKVQGMGKKAIEEIDKLKPYKGGNDALWHLHKLNIIDKHRLLITVGSAPVAHRPPASIRQDRERRGFVSDRLTPIFLPPQRWMFPLKAGDVLFTDAPDSEVDENMQFLFDIAFNEPKIIKGQSVFVTLQQMADWVDTIVSSLRPFLA